MGVVPRSMGVVPGNNAVTAPSKKGKAGAQRSEKRRRRETSSYRGVCSQTDRHGNRWRVQIWHEGHNIHVGSVSTEIGAALEYNRVVAILKGPRAVLNVVDAQALSAFHAAPKVEPQTSNYGVVDWQARVAALQLSVYTPRQLQGFARQTRANAAVKANAEVQRQQAQQPVKKPVKQQQQEEEQEEQQQQQQQQQQQENAEGTRGSSGGMRGSSVMPRIMPRIMPLVPYPECFHLLTDSAFY